MSTVYTDVATIQNAPTPSTLNSGGLVGARVRVIQAVYEASALATGSTIRVARLNKGDRVLLGGSHIIADALGSGTTLTLGDDDDTTAVDADRYLEATSTSSAAVIQLNDAVACIDKVPYAVQKDCWLTCTNADTATGTIQFEIYVAAP